MRDLVPGRPGPRLLFRLGLRNLLRNRRRTAITTVTVATAVFLLHVWSSLLTGLERQSYDNLIHYQTAHAKVLEAGWLERRDELPLDLHLTDADALLDRVRAVPGVAAAVPRIAFQAYLSDGRDQIPVLGIGIETAGSDDAVFRIRDAVLHGSYLEPGEEGLLVGSGLARVFGIEPGDWMTVLVRTRTGIWEAVELPVEGLITTANPAIDLSSVLMPLESARAMLDMQDRATELAVRFAPGAREDRVLARLRDSLADEAGIQVAGWREQEAEFIALTETKRGGGMLLMMIFVIVALVGVANTVLLAAFERTQEMGMLLAMGMRPASIRRLLLVEGGLAGLAAGVVGTLVALPILAYFSTFGLDFTAAFGDADIGYPVHGRVFPALMPVAMIAYTLATALLAAVVSFLPANRASRMKPAEALRHV
jgi:ABC-type lipoprotein release transport system permease subunit